MWLPQSLVGAPPATSAGHLHVNLSGDPNDHVEGIGRYLRKSMLLQGIVRFLAIVAPPMDENGIAFGFLLKPSPTTCDSNLGWIGHSVHGLCQFV